MRPYLFQLLRVLLGRYFSLANTFVVADKLKYHREADMQRGGRQD